MLDLSAYGGSWIFFLILNLASRGCPGGGRVSFHMQPQIQLPPTQGRRGAGNRGVCPEWHLLKHNKWENILPERSDGLMMISNFP